MLVRLGGPSCLAGDVIGDYWFESSACPRSAACVLGSSALFDGENNNFQRRAAACPRLMGQPHDMLQLQKQFSYEDFEGRLS